MEQWIIWAIAGGIMILLEFIVPGGIIVFLGVAASIVGLSVYLGFINTFVSALLAWFILSIFLMLVLRSFFMKYFEGDSNIENVDEDADLLGVLVEVVEEVLPYKEGRVRFRDTTWSARSEETFSVGSKATVSGRDGNHLIIKSL